jgi:hypothetical protein
VISSNGTAPPELSYDPARSCFLLIGTSKYNSSTLNPLPTVNNNLDKLEALIRDPSVIGAPWGAVSVLRDPRNKSEISDALLEASKKASDLSLIYYAGHGCLARGTNKLYLSVQNTTEEECQHNGFDFDEIRSILAKPVPDKRVILLDCCFSGNAIEGSLSTSDTQAAVGTLVETAMDVQADKIQPRSAYAIASAPANRLANAGEGKTYTAFSGELIELLEQGTGGGEDVLTMEEIYKKLLERIKLNPILPEPRRRVQHDGAALVFARNRKIVSVDIRLDSLARRISEGAAALDERLRKLEDRLPDEPISIRGVRQHSMRFWLRHY